jgi:hypothetical protein
MQLIGGVLIVAGVALVRVDELRAPAAGRTEALDPGIDQDAAPDAVSRRD